MEIHWADSGTADQDRFPEAAVRPSSRSSGTQKPDSGTIVDSTFIESPSSAKNKEKKHDPEAHSAKKRSTCHFDYQTHIGVDSQDGLVHTVKVTAGNVHDVTVTSERLTGEEETVYGDSGYLGADNRPEVPKKNKAGKQIRFKLNRRPSASKDAMVHPLLQLRFIWVQFRSLVSPFSP